MVSQTSLDSIIFRTDSYDSITSLALIVQSTLHLCKIFFSNDFEIVRTCYQESLFTVKSGKV